MKIVEIVTREYYYEDENGTRTIMPIGVCEDEEITLPIEYDANGYDENGYDRNGLDKKGNSVFDDLGED